MKPATTQPPAAGEAAHTPTPYGVRHYAGKTEIRAIGDRHHMGHTWIVAEVFGDTGSAFRGHGSPEANAAFIVRACNSHAALVEALERQIEHTEQLSGMVNRFADKLGLGKKVNAEDWTDLARAALAQAKGGAS